MTDNALQRRLVIAGMLFAALGAVVGFRWLCTRSDAIPFLPAKVGALWIVYPTTASADMNQAVLLTARFRHGFDLAGQPEQALLAARAFRGGAVWVNGVAVANLRLNDRDWKSLKEADVARLLRNGHNEIMVTVTNALGPPALWLRLQTPEKTIGTDVSWEVSQRDDPWKPAQSAARPPPIVPGSYLGGQAPLPTLLRQSWLSMLVLVLVSASGVALWHWRNRTCPSTAPRGSKSALGLSLQNAMLRSFLRFLTTRARPALLLVCLAWIALFANNLPQLPRLIGFDAEGHEEYIRYIQQKGALPLADEGWQMYQPPLYYLAAALALEASALTTADDASVTLLRAFNGVVGLAQCALVFLCLCRLFPTQRWKQVAGTAFAGFVPAHLYVSHYVTNETLSATFVTAAIYFCLRVLRKDQSGDETRKPTSDIRDALLAGLALGLALLTKFSAVLAVPVLAGALGWRWIERRRSEPRRGLRNLGLFLGSMLAVSGWHYARVWAHFGQPLVGNWNAASGFAWWQAPGCHTAEYYASFGEVFRRPLFSSLTSFADGLYATLWGDGLVGSAAWMAFRPPWNYDFMGWGWVLAGVAAGLILVGFAVGVARVLHQTDVVWVMFTGLLAIFALGMVYMSLRVPSYAQVKAFYGLPALLPLTVVLLAGWEWLASRSRWLGVLLQVWFATWMLTICATFWVRSGNPETHVVQAIWALDRGRIEAAAQHYERAARLDPRNWAVTAGLMEAIRVAPRVPAFRGLLGQVMQQQDRMPEAILHYREALRLQPANPVLLNNLAWILATQPQAELRNGQEAVRLAEQACELTGRTEATLLGTLAAAYAEAGQFTEAVATATQARELALKAGQRDVAAKNAELIEVYRSGKAWREGR